MRRKGISWEDDSVQKVVRLRMSERDRAYYALEFLRVVPSVRFFNRGLGSGTKEAW